MKLFPILFPFLLFIPGFAFAQNLRSTTVEEMQRQIETTNDTLYVYNFWATWCRPCVQELPYFARLDSVYSDRKMRLILVSLDFSHAYESRLKPFIELQIPKLEVWHLRDGLEDNRWIGEVSSDWSGALPGTLLVGPEGLYEFREQSFDYDSLRAWVVPNLPR